MSWLKSSSVPNIKLTSTKSGCPEECEELLGDSVNETFDVAEPQERKMTKTSAGFIAAAVALSIANFIFCIGQFSSATKPSSTLYGSDLEFASTYINIEVNAHETNHSLDNMPLVVGTVDLDHPNVVRPDETPHWKSFEGVVIPDRRHILVNETISTIVQFRVLDFGLEICRPTIILPTFASLIDANSTVKSEGHKPRAYRINGAPPTLLAPIHVWILESMSPKGFELELNLKQMTFAGLPPRKSYLGTIDAQEGKTATTDWFACKSTGLYTLELSCDRPGCLVDFWSDDIEPRMAFVIQQFAYVPEGTVIDN
ncbi:hypothetical protein SCHPADRAFT_488309 [Schizopora paradoxa]|uniref:Ubiquitin 3 binding protein But2 C-terminal domain-containing protein n=1 Tax=Schizopora paradoxa TaxID=27342 RepID=A0A0H2RHM9_9AGAM|nr:hypothetical protein SCHPADRAFT_488309 [Schizopora paradoxa]